MHKRFILLFLSVLSLMTIYPAAAFAATVKVEALGFFSHPPMWENRDTITKVCQQFGDKVELTLYDETTEEGQKFMENKGLSGHLPMVLYINGSVAHKLGDRVVVFRDFIGQDWTEKDLDQVIRLNLEGKKTAVAAPANATTESWNPGAIPPGASLNGPGANDQVPANTSGLLMYLLGGATVLVAVVFYMIGRKNARGR